MKSQILKTAGKLFLATLVTGTLSFPLLASASPLQEKMSKMKQEKTEKKKMDKMDKSKMSKMKTDSVKKAKMERSKMAKGKM